MVIIRPGDIDRDPEVVHYTRAVTAEELGTVIGGYVEAVPGFSTIGFAGVVMSCVAFCNEHGKLDKLPVNEPATAYWERSLRRQGMQLLDDKTQIPKDWLVGNVVVLFGDGEFMAAL
jgi:hypothetical protein